MALYLTHNPLMPGADYPGQPVANSYQYIEKTYSAAGAAEWIYLPDRMGASVTLSFSGGSTGKLQATDSPPSVIATGSPVVIDWTPGVVAATCSVFVEGFTAIRVFVSSGSSVTISVGV